MANSTKPEEVVQNNARMLSSSSFKQWPIVSLIVTPSVGSIICGATLPALAESLKAILMECLTEPWMRNINILLMDYFEEGDMDWIMPLCLQKVKDYQLLTEEIRP
jgi:hypothetical protein